MKRNAIIVSGVILAAMLLAPLLGLGGEAATGTEARGAAVDDAIKIGLAVPLSGDLWPLYGEPTKNGFLMAVEEANAAGGIDGRLIEYAEADSQCSPEGGTDAANKLITQDQVVAIIGALCSSASIPMSEIAQANGVVQITPTSTGPGVSEGKDYVFRACFPDTFQAKMMAHFARKTLRTEKAAVLYEIDSPYSEGLAECFRDGFVAEGGAVNVFEPYHGGETDFSSQLDAVVADNSDVLFLPGFVSEVNLIAAQARAKGITAIFLGCDAWDSPDLDKTAVDGSYFITHFCQDDPRSVTQDFVAAYEAKYGSTPDWFAALGYDATNILFEAMRQAGTDDPAQVKDAMAAMKNFEGVSGRIYWFDQDGNPVKDGVLLHVTGGEVEYVGPVSPVSTLNKIYLPLVMKSYVSGVPTPTPTATATPTTTPTPPPGKPMDGLWKGQSVTDGYPAETRPITFTVEAGGTRIASGARIDTYFREEDFFTCWGTMQWTINYPISIASDSTFHFSGGLIDKLTWDGQFVSSTRVEGTFHTEILAGVCGKVVNDGTWEATWQGSSTPTGGSE